MKEKFKGLFAGKKKIIWIIIAVVILIVAGIFIARKFIAKSADATDGEYVEVASPLSKHDLSGAINVTGTVESREVLAVTTELTNSKIKELNVALGDRVNAGDVLCSFDDETIKENIEALEKSVSEAQKAQAKALADAQRSLAIYNLNPDSDKVAAAQQELSDIEKSRQDNYNTMVQQLDAKSNAIANGETDQNVLYGYQKAADDAYFAMIKDEQKLSYAEQKLEIARLQQEGERANELYTVDAAANATTDYTMTKELANLYNQLKQTTVTSDQTGVVTKLNVQKGSIASGTLMQIEDDSKLRVKVNIRERDIIKLKPGMKVKLTADAFPDQTFSGEVAQVINFASSSVDAYTGEAQSSSTGNSYSAYINVDDGSPLLLGMTVKVEILLDASEPALAVGFDSILYDDNGNSYVLRAVDQSDGTYLLERVDVEVGESGDYYTEISSPDLSEGDIIVSYPYSVSEGDKIPLEIVEGDDMMAPTDGVETEGGETTGTDTSVTVYSE